MFIRLLYVLIVALHANNKKINESLALIGGTTVITSREVKIHYHIESILNGDEKKAQLDLSTANLDNELSKVVLENVLYMEAENFSIGSISPDELKEKVELVELRLKSNPIWNELDVKSSELQVFVSRLLRAKTFLKYKTDTTVVSISDEDAKSYFEKNRLKFGNMPYAHFRENIKNYLSKIEGEAKMKDWFEALKRKYKVKYIEVPKGA